MQVISSPIRRPVMLVLTLISLLCASIPTHSMAGLVVNSSEESPQIKQLDKNSTQKALQDYGNLPLHFEMNQGQVDKTVKYIARGQGYTLTLSSQKAVLKLVDAHKKGAAIRMTFPGSNVNSLIEGQQLADTKINYFIGNDKSKWLKDVATFRETLQRDVWPGIDLVWHGRRQQLEYDFIVKPGVNPSQIQLAFDGATAKIDGEGNLILQTGAGNVTHQAPVIYQDAVSGRKVIPGKYVLSNNIVRFEVGNYDRTQPLVIDPVLVYSSYLGGNSFDLGAAVAIDDLGQAVVVGSTRSSEDTFPLVNAFQDFNITETAFITKLNSSGTDVLFSTFLGDASGFCSPGDSICGAQAHDVALGTDGKIYLTGVVDNRVNESSFPITANAYQGNGVGCVGGCGARPQREFDAFVSVFNPNANVLVYSTFLAGNTTFVTGGVDIGESIAVDNLNRVYVTGSTSSRDFPTKNAFQSSRNDSFTSTEAFLAIFNPSATNGNDTLVYSSFLGGEGDDVGLGIAVDQDRNAYIVGKTSSMDLPVRSPSSLPPLRGSFQGGTTDGFVAKFDGESVNNSSLTYLTYFGGNGNDRVQSVAVDAAQRVYITGATISSPASFPLLNAFDATQVNGEAFVAKLNADGTSLFYSSFLGGSNGAASSDAEEGLGITIDPAGNAYVVGRTTSGSTFPLGTQSVPFDASKQGTAFIAKIEANITGNTIPKLLQSTTFGGIGTKATSVAIDSRRDVFITGTTIGNLPVTPNAFQGTFNGGSTDSFVARIKFNLPDTIGVFRPSISQFQLRNSNTAGPADLLIDFGQAGDIPVAGDWNGDGETDVGVFRPSAGQFILRKPLFGNSTINIRINFGQSGDLPVVGDWDGDGKETPGVFRPGATGTFLLTNETATNSTPLPDIQFTFGVNGDLPVAGDWNSDGIDTVGVFRPGVPGAFFLANQFQNFADIFFNFGTAGDLPLAGDWTGKGNDTVGVFRPSKSTMFLANNFVNVADIFFVFGQSGDLPVAGDWDGQ
jgi:hypothetical protein